MNIRTLIGEATAYDKKQQLEVKRPNSWLKSVSAFANGEGGTLVFGISDDDQVVGLADAEGDSERISEEIKTKLDPIPAVNLEFKEVDGKKLVLLHVYKGQETPYYYIGDKQRENFCLNFRLEFAEDVPQLSQDKINKKPEGLSVYDFHVVDIESVKLKPLSSNNNKIYND